MRKSYAYIALITLAFAQSAHAAPVISYATSPNGSFTAYFGDTPGVTGAFDDLFTSFTITNPHGGTLTGSLSTAGVYPANSLNFSMAQILGPGGPFGFTITKSPLSGTTPPYTNPTGLQTGSLGGITLGPGTYQLNITGTTGKVASLAGTLSFSAGTPEPSTWALMILGFGVIGVALRRQRAATRPQMRVNYA